MAAGSSSETDMATGSGSETNMSSASSSMANISTGKKSVVNVSSRSVAGELQSKPSFTSFMVKEKNQYISLTYHQREKGYWFLTVHEIQCNKMKLTN